MATRRAFPSSALRVAARTIVSRPARPAFAAVSRTQLIRPVAVNGGARAWGVRRSYSTEEEFKLDSRVWSFEDIKNHLEAAEGKDNIVIVGTYFSRARMFTLRAHS